MTKSEPFCCKQWHTRMVRTHSSMIDYDYPTEMFGPRVQVDELFSLTHSNST